MNLFVVHSQFGALNIVEARHKYKTKPQHSVLLIITPRNINNILKICQQCEWAEIKSLPWFVYGTHSPISWAKRNWICYSLLRETVTRLNSRIDRIFLQNIIEPVSRFIHHLIPSAKFIQFDDGNDTLSSCQVNKKSDLNKYMASNDSLRRSLFCLMGLAIPPIPAKEVDFFSFYDLSDVQGIQVTKNNFHVIRSRVNPQPLLDEKWLVSSPLHHHTNGITKDKYTDLIATAVENIGPFDKIKYIPHPAEEHSISTFVKKHLGIEVYRPDTCLEYYLSKRDHWPKNIYTFSSTCTFSCPKIFPGLQTSILSPPQHLFENTRVRNFFRLVKEYAQKKHPEIKIIEIE